LPGSGGLLSFLRIHLTGLAVLLHVSKALPRLLRLGELALLHPGTLALITSALPRARFLRLVWILACLLRFLLELPVAWLSCRRPYFAKFTVPASPGLLLFARLLFLARPLRSRLP
jgi:hypothetical protein